MYKKSNISSNAKLVHQDESVQNSDQNTNDGRGDKGKDT